MAVVLAGEARSVRVRVLAPAIALACLLLPASAGAQGAARRGSNGLPGREYRHRRRGQAAGRRPGRVPGGRSSRRPRPVVVQPKAPASVERVTAPAARALRPVAAHAPAVQVPATPTAHDVTRAAGETAAPVTRLAGDTLVRRRRARSGRGHESRAGQLDLRDHRRLHWTARSSPPTASRRRRRSGHSGNAHGARRPGAGAHARRSRCRALRAVPRRRSAGICVTHRHRRALRAHSFPLPRPRALGAGAPRGSLGRRLGRSRRPDVRGLPGAVRRRGPAARRAHAKTSPAPAPLGSAPFISLLERPG